VKPRLDGVTAKKTTQNTLSGSYMMAGMLFQYLSLMKEKLVTMFPCISTA